MQDSNVLTMLLAADIRFALKKQDEPFIREILSHLHAADIADILESLNDDEAVVVFRLITEEVKVEAFEHLEEHQRERVFRLVPRESIVPVIENMSADDRADLMKALPQEMVDNLLPLLAQAERNDIKKLVNYAEGTAGAVMTTEYVDLFLDKTVSETLDIIRKIAPHRETIYYMYVVDSEHRLMGHISLQDLVLARPQDQVENVMNPNVISCKIDTDQEDVAQTILKYDFLALPVVDGQNKLVGIVTHDDIMDVVVLEGTEDAHKMAAVSPLEDPYAQTPFWSLVRKRVFWLSILFVGEMFTSSALHSFEAVLNQYIMLVFFIPLIISAGGNTGSQSSTLIVREMSVGNITFRDWGYIMRRETCMGLVMGVALGCMGFGRALLLGTSIYIAVIVMLAVLLIVLLGAFLGSILPLVFERMGMDPAVTSTPFVASLVDVFGIIIYLMLAKIILGV